MKRKLYIEVETPELPSDRSIIAPYVIEALLTYVRGVETGAFGVHTVERITTITHCRLVARYEAEESQDAGRPDNR